MELTKKNRYLLALSALVVILVGGASIFWYTSRNVAVDGQDIPYDDDARVVVRVGDNEFQAEVAATQSKKQKGLSIYTADQFYGSQAMIFLFRDYSTPTFWMKDTTFDIDILWIRDNTIIDLDPNVEHPAPGVDDAILARYTPSEPVNIVLELPAGGADGISVGDTVTYEIVQ